MILHHRDMSPRCGWNHNQPGFLQLGSLPGSAFREVQGLSFLHPQDRVDMDSFSIYIAKSSTLPLDDYVNVATYKNTLQNILLSFVKQYIQDNFC